MQKGEKARQESRWADCIRHFQNALGSGERVPEEHRKIIQSYIDSCKRRL
jgi:hypothetical protein